jgi:hypothetical protein
MYTAHGTLLIAYCPRSSTHFPLLTVHCTVHCPLFPVNCPLFIANLPLPTLHCSLSTAPLLTAICLLSNITAHCLLPAAHCSLPNAYSAAVHCPLFTLPANCPLHTVTVHDSHSQKQAHIPLWSQYGLCLTHGKIKEVRHEHTLSNTYVIIPLHLYCQMWTYLSC